MAFTLRQLLDTLLQQAAHEAGAKFLDCTRVTGIIRDGNRVCGVEAATASRPKRFKGDLVIGADGRHSVLARQVGAREYFAYDAPRTIYWAYWDAPSRWKDDPAYQRDYYLGHKGGDFRAVFQTDHGQILIATNPPVEQARRWRSDLPRAYLSDLCSDPFTAGLVEDGRLDGKIQGKLRERFFFREVVGPGWVLVGDAGHYKDFIIGDGICCRSNRWPPPFRRVRTPRCKPGGGAATRKHGNCFAFGRMKPPLSGPRNCRKLCCWSSLATSN